MTYLHRFSSPVGGILLAADETALTGLWFDGAKHCAATLPPAAREAQTPVLAEAARWLTTYFSGQVPGFTVPLRPHGTAFQQEIWALLGKIPYGQTTTYGALAAQWSACHGGARMSAQAVGGAVGRNPIAILIPCHRVLGSDGSLTGYAGGTERKHFLLELEKAAH